MLLACSDEADISLCPDGKCDMEYLDDSRIEVTMISQNGYFLDVQRGDRQVFRRTFEYNENPAVMDDELREILLFEIDGEATSFTYSGTSLNEANVYYLRSCAFCLPGYHKITSGTLSGMKRNDGSWRIQADLEHQDAVAPLTFDAIFR